MSLASGHIVVPIEKEVFDQVQKHFLGVTRGLVRLQPGGWVFPEFNPTLLDDIFHFKFLPSDVVVMTYPKCGTTWTQEIVWTMRNNPDLDHPNANIHMFARSPFMEVDILVTGDKPTSLAEPQLFETLNRLSPDIDPKGSIFLQLSKVLPNPRTFKTHRPFSLMPKNLLDTCKIQLLDIEESPSYGDVLAIGDVLTMERSDRMYTSFPFGLPRYERENLFDLGRERRSGSGAASTGDSAAKCKAVSPGLIYEKKEVIYVARNPFDACVSYCHHCRTLKIVDYSGSLSDFVDYYVKGDVFYGSYMEHFKEAWSKRGHKNLHFMFFEDNKRDPLKEMKKLNSFLGTELSDEALSKIVDYTSFSAMKKRPTYGHETVVQGESDGTTGENVGFFRKGEAGNWKQRLTKEDEEKIRSWMDAALENIDFKFQEEVGE